jgi:nucleoside triphosphate diphosphatase
MKPVLPGRDRPYERLVAIMAALRGEPGCPWDLGQDLPGLLHYMESEFQEVAQAVHAGDPASLREELGDLLFNIVFMARVAEEQGWFTMEEVASEIGDKLIRRHPHVFTDPRSLSVEEAGRLWQELKAREKKERGKTGTGPSGD